MKRYYVFLTLICLSYIARAFPVDPLNTTVKDAPVVFADKDRDGIYDDRDNCPDVYNPYQDDSDGDGIGDVCDNDDCDCSYENQWIYVCQDGRTRRVTCSALTNPNTYCGPCEEKKVECASCEADQYGKITFCRIPLNPNNLRTVYGSCNELYNYFNDDGSFKNSKDQCGPCDCAMIGDKDSDGDGVCDRKDECPDNPDKSEAGMCGCDDDDTDKDWVCDSEDVCPGWNDKKDDDGDGIPNGCDICPHGDDKKDYDGDGIPDACDICPHGDDKKDYDGDGIPDDCDICPHGDDKKDYDGDGIPDDCDICPGGDDNEDQNNNGVPDECEINCCPASGYSDYEWIDNTKFNDLFINSGDDGGYGDYRSVKIRTSRGANLSLWVTPGYIDDICELSIAAYIDWNGDKDFEDDGELVYSGRTLEETGADVRVPNDAYLGDVCVRIIVDYGRIRGACDPCIDGEVEDYTLTIEDNLCSLVYEPFDYSIDSDIQGKNGGLGWSSPWTADKSGNARARVLQNSLFYQPLESNGHKLAVMNEPISLLTVKRELDYAAEDELWMSFLYMRDGGLGTFFLEFGDLVIDINSAGNFWIGDLSGPAVQNQLTYFILIKVIFTPGKEDVYMWINPNTDFAPDPNDALHVQMDIENSFEDLSMTFKSIDGSETIYQYVDEIRIGCERSDVAKHDESGGNLNTSVPSSFIVAPNPVTPGFPVGIILNNSSFFEGTMSIYTNDGQPVKTGTIYAGLNTVETDDLLPGLYLMEIKTNDSVMTERLLIQN